MAAIILIDDSLSTSRGRTESVFSQQQALTTAYIETLQEGDEVTIIRMSELHQPWRSAVRSCRASWNMCKPCSQALLRRYSSPVAEGSMHGGDTLTRTMRLSSSVMALPMVGTLNGGVNGRSCTNILFAPAQSRLVFPTCRIFRQL